MKNIHILPTDKPSRFLYNSTLKSFCIQKEIDGMFINDGKVSGADFWGLEKALNNGFKPYNIHITSNEEIKEGDWTLMFDDFGHLFLCDKPQQYLGIEKGHHLNKGLRKIILTTDFTLSPDVHKIPDEFLEWFVKNPSCEEVEVELKTKQLVKPYDVYNEIVSYYKIIIPKEEPKQERMYSEEEVLEIIRQYALEEHLITSSKPDIWFEQFKKKYVLQSNK